jgi:hypothetical protein
MIWGHLKVFGDAINAAGGESFELAFKQFMQYAPDKVLL